MYTLYFWNSQWFLIMLNDFCFLVELARTGLIFLMSASRSLDKLCESTVPQTLDSRLHRMWLPEREKVPWLSQFSAWRHSLSQCRRGIKQQLKTTEQSSRGENTTDNDTFQHWLWQATCEECPRAGKGTARRAQSSWSLRSEQPQSKQAFRLTLDYHTVPPSEPSTCILYT